MALLTTDRAAELHEPEFAAIGAQLPGGVIVVDGPNRRAYETLYTMVSGPKPAEAGSAIETLENEFLTPGRTLSARLIDGVKNASRRVYTENRLSLPRDRYSLDLALMVLRENDALFTLGGSARAYVIRGGKLFDIGLQIIGPRLGEDDPAVPVLLPVQLLPTDIVLMAGGDLLDYASAEHIAAWFEAGIKRGAAWLASAIGNEIAVIAFEPGAYPAETRGKGRTFSLRGADTLNNLPLDQVGGMLTGASGAAVSVVTSLSKLVGAFVPSEPAGDEPDIDEAPAQRLTLPRIGARPKLVLIGLAAAVILIATGVLISSIIASSNTEQNYLTAMDEAQRAYHAVATSTDPIFSRARLREADFAIQQALAAKSGDSDAQKLAENIKADIAKLNKVVNLSGAAQVTDLSATGAKNPLSLIVEGGNGYVLDDSGWGIRRVGLEANKPAEPQLIATNGTDSDDGKVGNLIAMGWLAASEKGNRVGLMMLDKDRNLFYLPSGKPLVSLALRGASAWKSVQTIRGYLGNLYVLDPKGNQVWRYLPNWSGYDSEMKGMLDNASIEDAQDFTIDGNIYVLTKGGKVWKFTDGAGTEFDLRSLDKPLNNPTAILTGATARGVYVADPANNRIVVFDKEGRFTRQIISPTFANMKSFVVDEALGKLVYLSGTKVFTAPLPK